MKETKPGYKPMIFLTVLLTLSAIATMIPYSGASKESFIGYKAFCSHAPASTIILLLCSGIVCKIRKKKFVVGD
jgi:nitrite reductase/ring-hydroxylating ferredoxin subunit